MKTEKCNYCFNVVKIKTSGSMSSHLSKCKVWNEKRKKIIQDITKDFLYEHHIVKQMPPFEISKLLGLKHVREINCLLKQFGIPRQTFLNNVGFKQKRKEKTKETNNKKYGCDFGLSNKKTRQKIEETCLNKYGVKNVFASNEIKHEIEKVNLEKYDSKTAISSLIIKEKIKNTILSKYGVDNVFKAPEIIKKIKDKKLISEKNQSYSSINANRVFNFLYGCLETTTLKNQIYYADLNKEFGKKFGDNYFYYDFILSRLKFCIEYNGCYHHADPRKYKPDFEVHKKKAKEIWQRDKLKIQSLYNVGFEIWIIWENDFEVATDLYLCQILHRINYLDRHQNSSRIIFESNVEKDNKTLELNNSVWNPIWNHPI